MKRYFLTGGLLMLTVFLWAQRKVTFEIAGLPLGWKADSAIYLAGSFNNWNPGNDRYRLKKDNGKYGITIEVPAGEIEYKFTLGSWNKVELRKDGSSIENRKLRVESDTTLQVEIENWANHSANEQKESTASKNVHVLSTDFFMPQLNSRRRIWVYLPESYAHSKKRYPVLYMQDGQNVFDAATSFSGEWGVDEALDSLGKEVGECIVIAVDNGGEKRINEYCPYDMEKYGKGEGDQYLSFLVHTLKPYVDHHFRTKKGAQTTWIAGSSMGGLISFYAMLKYPGTFGAAGVFSPAFWIAPALGNDVDKLGKRVKGRIFFYAGSEEGESMVPGMMSIYEKMQRVSNAAMETVIRTGGHHSEANWRSEFPGFYRFLAKAAKEGKGAKGMNNKQGTRNIEY